MKVLIVEDEPVLRTAMKVVLECDGFQVEIAENGKEAIQSIRESSSLPRVILLDLKMPVMDGREFLQFRERDSVLSSIPVIVVSATPEKMKHDVLCSLSKPVDFHFLKSLLREFAKIHSPMSGVTAR